jgi:diguanylate cyclase (GGDEF)-like protein/putative nucleotidyltransferase with HDIG domain
MPIREEIEVSLSKKSQLKMLPRAAQSMVLLFGIIGLYGLVGAVAMIGRVDYAYLGLLLFLAVITGHTKVRLVGGSSLSLITTVALVAMMMLGPAAGVLVGACGVIVQCTIPRRKFIPHHLIFNLGMIVVTLSLASWGYYAVVRNPHAAGIDRLIGSLIASILYYFGSSVCVSIIVGLSGKKSIFRVWHDNFLYTAPSFVVAGFLAFLVSQFAASMRATVLLVVAPILYLCYYSYRVYIESLEKEKHHAGEMAELFNSTLSTLALAIDAKDKNTHGHIQRVQKYSRAIAEAMHLSEEEIKAIAAAALLHDIGKLAVPEYILSKQGPLSTDEMRKMRMHPQLGAEIISNIKFPYPVADSILAHHERFDGSGYPNGLAGQDIPLGARVLAVADVFDACTSDRVECAETIDGAISSLREGSGTFFDPEIVSVWESIYRDVVTWPAAASTTAYTDIQRVTSELKILEELEQSLAKVQTIAEISGAVSEVVKKRFPECDVVVKAGSHDGIPVEAEGKTIATISVGHTDACFTDDEIGLIRAVAEKIGGPFSKALALEGARRDATVDKLTGLANRRAFEVTCASLGDQPISIVLVDVNAFKAVNDNFGHKAGDEALIRIAAHVHAAFPDAHLTCRLGGDEFVVLSNAGNHALRMQIRNFRRMVVWDPAHDLYKKMMFGVSCGLAAVPADGENIEQAMHCADERMYAIKTRFKQFAGRGMAVVR